MFYLQLVKEVLTLYQSKERQEKKQGIMKVQFTDLEKQVLRNFLPTQNVFDFGEDPNTINEISFKVFDTEKALLLPSQIKGIVGSLVKKEILSSEDHELDGKNLIYLNDQFYKNQDLLNELIELTK